MSGWTEARQAILTELWMKGHTAAEIAMQLGNVSRSAVIGKVHRLKLKRATPSRPKKARARPVKRRGYVRAPQPGRPIVRRRRRKRYSHIDVPSPVKLASGAFADLMTIKRNMCHWPYGDPSDKDFHFCGHQVSDGKSYCDCHHEMAYRGRGGAIRL